METAQTTQQSATQSAWNKRPLIISGPCSAETEEQVIETAQRLAKTGKVDMLRAGIWKPRTKPGMFEGIGAKGLPWLQQAKKITGLPTTVEVATGKQVEDALTFDVMFFGLVPVQLLTPSVFRKWQMRCVVWMYLF
jgi:chorismate mutase